MPTAKRRAGHAAKNRRPQKPYARKPTELKNNEQDSVDHMLESSQPDDKRPGWKPNARVEARWKDIRVRGDGIDYNDSRTLNRSGYLTKFGKTFDLVTDLIAMNSKTKIDFFAKTEVQIDINVWSHEERNKEEIDGIKDNIDSLGVYFRQHVEQLYVNVFLPKPQGRATETGLDIYTIPSVAAICELVGKLKEFASIQYCEVCLILCESIKNSDPSMNCLNHALPFQDLKWRSSPQIKWDYKRDLKQSPIDLGIWSQNYLKKKGKEIRRARQPQKD